MGLLKGKSSCSIFQVTGELPDDPLSFINERVKAFSFKDIDDTFDEFSAGWVSILDMFNVNHHPAYGDYIAMSLRVDERKVQTTILKKFIDKESRRIKEERQIPKLSRTALAEIKERIRTEMIRKAKPAPAVFDLFWNLDSGHVVFFSTNAKAKAILEDFFKETFGLTLRQQIPPTVLIDAIGEADFNAITPLIIA